MILVVLNLILCPLENWKTDTHDDEIHGILVYQKGVTTQVI